MARRLRVVTGGHYTDAVRAGDVGRVFATAKALAAKDDLSVGMGNAVDGVLGGTVLSG